MRLAQGHNTATRGRIKPPDLSLRSSRPLPLGHHAPLARFVSCLVRIPKGMFLLKAASKRRNVIFVVFDGLANMLMYTTITQ